jgi:hypothetical protein
MAVQAKAVVLYAQLGSIYYPVACAKDVNITTTSDFLELAPRSSIAWREYEYNRLSGVISGTGITKIDTTESLYSIFDIAGFQFNQLKFLVKFSAVENDVYRVFECNVLVKELNIQGSASAFSSYNYELQISGPVIISTTPVLNTNPSIQVYEYEATGTVSSLVLPFSVDAVLVVVYINGVSKKINLSPSGYGANEVQYDAVTQTLVFGTSLAADDYVKIIYVDVESSLVLEDGLGFEIEDGLGDEILVG